MVYSGKAFPSGIPKPPASCWPKQGGEEVASSLAELIKLGDASCLPQLGPWGLTSPDPCGGQAWVMAAEWGLSPLLTLRGKAISQLLWTALELHSPHLLCFLAVAHETWSYWLILFYLQSERKVSSDLLFIHYGVLSPFKSLMSASDSPPPNKNLLNTYADKPNFARFLIF